MRAVDMFRGPDHMAMRLGCFPGTYSLYPREGHPDDAPVAGVRMDLVNRIRGRSRAATPATG